MATSKAQKRLSILAALSAILVWAVPAGASHVLCGDTLTTDTVLDSSLLDCPGNGLIIGADNITVELNGNVVKGADAPGSVGIQISDRIGVTVKGPGVVERFEGGIDITGGGQNTVKDVTVANNKLLSCLPVIPPGPRGIQIRNSANNRIKGNAVVNNCRGIVVVGPDSQGNSVRENSSTLNFFFGILVRNGPHNNEIKSNTLTGNTGPGVSLAQNVSENEVAENFIHSNSLGITLQGNADRNRVKENVITNNGALGVRLGFDGPPFPVVSDNNENEIRENVIGNQITGIFIQDVSDDGNVIKENTFFNTPTPISDAGTGTVIGDNVSD